MFFSIITVSLNARDLIADTVNSALCQNFNDFEIIVKDGGSSDGTLDMVPYDDRIKIIKKKDEGIYEGMNQAIAESKGKYLVFMNCGDKFYDDTVLSQAYERLSKKETSCILYGKRFTENKGVVEYPTVINKRFFYYSTLCHQSSFIPREAFDRVGYYDEGLKIASDWKFFLDAYIAGVEFEYCNSVFCSFADGGVSETEKGFLLGELERKPIKKSRFSFFEKIYIPMLNTKAGRVLVSLKKKIKKG